MDAVRAVDIHVPRRAEHCRVARRAAAEAVRGGVFVVVRLHLHDRPADTVDEKRCADQLARDVVHVTREEVAPDLHASLSRFASYRIRAGNASATRRVPNTQAMPPLTIENRSDVADATTPASTLPSGGALATCMNSIPVKRRRRASGVALSMIVERMTALMLSAAPARASSTSPIHNPREKPKAAIAIPHADAAIATASPWRRTC